MRELADTLDVSILDPAAAMTMSGALSGSGGLFVSGAGSLILAGDNSFSGGTTVDGGVLYITSSASLASGSSLGVAAGGTLIFDPSYAARRLDSAARASQVPRPQPSRRFPNREHGRPSRPQ